MKVIKFDMYKDGGTSKITTDEGVYCFDNRLGSTTKGRLYDDMPKKDNSNLIEDFDELEQELIEALKLYHNEFYQVSINHLIETKQK
jgi:hypothetical protein